MAIEKYFDSQKNASIIFDPIPSYDGDWYFDLENLFKNAKKENGNNLFQAFFDKTYATPLINIFNTKRVLDLSCGMLCCPNENGIGRSLKYNKYEFFISLTEFLNQHLDNYGRTKDENQKYLQSLLENLTKDNDTLYVAYSNALQVKSEKLKDLMENEIDSEYFEAAMQDYGYYKDRINFTNYLKSSYEITTKFQSGILKLGDFFDHNIDYNELVNCFDPDVFYLLFAKIIYEYNLMIEKDYGKVDNSHMYLYQYLEAVKKIVQDDKKYNPQILYTLPSRKKIKYSRWMLKEEVNALFNRHPELKFIKLPNLDNGNYEKYRDITLIKKIVELYNSDIKLNWQFLPKGEKIKRNNDVAKVPIVGVSKEKSKEDILSEVNERINLLESSNYLGTPIKGLNTFSGYYAFIYPNGNIILEKFWENENTLNPAINCATYVMNIDNFIEMSKLPKINLIEYIKTLPEISVKRIFHTTNENWQRNLLKEINGSYRLEDAIEFIATLNSGELKNE